MRRLGLLGGLVLAGLVAAPAGALPRDTPTPSPTRPPLPITVTLSRLDPRAPQPGSRLVLAGALRNTGGLQARSVTVQLRVSQIPVHTRDELAQLADNSNGPIPGSIRDVSRTTVSVHTIAPGGSASWRIEVPVDDLHLPQPWLVYKMGIEVVGCTDDGCGALGRLRTFLPWAPLGPGAGKASRIAWVWPLADRPHRAGSPAWTDDQLTDLFRGGELAALVDAAASARKPPPAARAPAAPKGKPARPRIPILAVPVTWAIDPMLVEDASAMASGYQVVTKPGAKPVAGKGKQAAAAWLQALRAAVSGQPVVALPYADVDAAALVRAGLSEDFRLAMSAGHQLARQFLDATILDDVYWPPRGRLDQRTLDTLFGSRIDTVVLADAALPLLVDPGRTPGARATVNARDGALNALLVDDGLRQIAEGGSAAPGGIRVAEQRFLAETLMIGAEAPSLQRDLVVAPERRWRPNPAYAAALLDDSGRVPWLQPATLPDVIAGPQPMVVRGSLSYPAAARDAELSGPYLSVVQEMRASLDGLATIVPPNDPTIRDLDYAVFRAESSAWRGRGGAAVIERDRIRDALDTARGRVRIASAPGSLVTLTSHSGTVPVTIANDLDSPAKVLLRLDAGERLSVAGAGSIVQVLPPHRQVTVEVSARARTAGVFPLTVSLETPQVPHQQLQQVELLVRSTVYGTVALTITGAAAGVLFLAVIVRLVRRGVRARRAAGAAG